MHRSSSFRPDRLVAERTKAGLSRQDLAHKAGIRPAVLDDYEAGARTPNAKMLAGLAEAVGCQLQDLLNPVEERDLRTLREQASGLGPGAAAAAVQMSRGSLAMLEAGRTTELKDSVAAALAAVYGTSEEEVREAHQRSVATARSTAPLWLTDRTMQRLANHLGRTPDELRELIETIQDEERRG
ncbi:helix-turn-helix transcriptional regulator [Streptomyces sp. TLI_171]|uniref:helix-turn-helix transcriptional regulator n=1 Tax=Streptomyces sp. TLI_171 TaxID=1938859 RepID=UPI000C17ABB0|nr:helix-turn-helix transcriptional regulator [Streptomyces sp. TLI_171]RKE03011.1 helix-turn-helix protein [Streptomyces sp. TLI_171]